ncbi:KIFAP3 [Cordylochernes scorpioides]|uniref:KIFAP3 n=1 Tax=Cordylochernes scorpioides TaxID=51811 RepID=A0ABY6LUA1_9ARAC|nr:KIFAP3 [Cordylochernes scorpioides]
MVTALDAHPTEQALILHFELEAALLGQYGDTLLEESKECQKTIYIDNLTEFTDIPALAKEILQRFDIIPYCKFGELEIILSFLKKRSGERKIETTFEGVSLEKMEEYIELLYGDMDEKIRGSSMALQIALNPANLGLLAENETFIGAICRVLREDGKSNIELAHNIIQILFCFSVYSSFHSLIIQQKIGSACMDLIEYHLNKKELHKQNLEKKLSQTDLGKLSSHQESSMAKFNNYVKKQENFFKISFSILLNLAEDIDVEIRMVNKGIVALLSRTLNSENVDLLAVAVSFLKKLSIYVENKNEMAKLNVIDKLVPLLSINDNKELISITLRLILNLSFDVDLRINMVKKGILSKLFNLLQIEEYRKNVLCILNHVSIEEKFKPLFSSTDCISTIVRLILECHCERIPIELISLGINLATNIKNAQVMCKDNGLKMLMRRAFRFKDPLLMKMIRNISKHDGPIKELFVDHVNNLGCSLHESDEDEHEEFIAECLGVLGNLNIPNLNFEKLFRKYSMTSWLKARLNIYCEDELLFNILSFLATAFVDEGAALLLQEEGIVNSILDLLNAKQEDDDMVLQIVYLIQQLLRHPKICKRLITDTHIPAYLLDLVHDKNSEIRKICDLSLDIIAEVNEEWAKKIQVEKFCWHNGHWIKAIHDQNGIFHEEDNACDYDDYDEDFYDHLKLIYSLGEQDDFTSDDDTFESDFSRPKCCFDSIGCHFGKILQNNPSLLVHENNFKSLRKKRPEMQLYKQNVFNWFDKTIMQGDKGPPCGHPLLSFLVNSFVEYLNLIFRLVNVIHILKIYLVISYVFNKGHCNIFQSYCLNPNIHAERKYSLSYQNNIRFANNGLEEVPMGTPSD